MTLSSNICHEVSCHLRLPRITSSPDNPLIGKRKENVTFSWKFELRPTETWNNSIVEVVFGEWKYPGFLKKKLMLINNTGKKIIRENYEKKISCHFDMSLLQVAFTLHDLDKSDENEYGVQVEFDLSQAPLTDSVKLRLEGNKSSIVVRTVSYSNIKVWLKCSHILDQFLTILNPSTIIKFSWEKLKWITNKGCKELRENLSIVTFILALVNNHPQKIQNFMLDVACLVIQDCKSISQESFDSVPATIIELL